MLQYGAVLLLCAMISACFGPTRRQGVLSARHSKVYLEYPTYYREGRFYTIGALPAGWERLKTNARAIAFYNESERSTIFTDAFCGTTFQDSPPEILIGNMVGGITKLTPINREHGMLDGRGTLRSRYTGELDGVPLSLDILVLKKDDCLFDFVAVAPRPMTPQVLAAFEGFFGGFHYQPPESP